MTDTVISSLVADNRITRRLYARTTWILTSPAHFGGDDTGMADMCLLRDINGQPFIPAASIAGAGRSFLARCQLPWQDYKGGLNRELQGLKRLFGGADKDDTMSALFVADATCSNHTTLVRDHVRIDDKTGTAAQGAKFDMEIIERNAEFQMCLECVIRHGDHKQEQTVEQLFLALLHGFQEGEIHLGARTRRGFGRGRVNAWEIRDLRMNCPADVLAWLRDDARSRPPSRLVPTPLPENRHEVFHLEADFILKTSLLIRSPSALPDAPDTVHLQSAGQAVAPGTSIAGVIRHRASLIAHTIGWSEDAVAEVFGPIHKQDNVAPSNEGLWASRVSIEEQLVKHVTPRRQHRVAIDRFTGGSLDNALFDEEPVYPTGTEPHLRLALTLEEPHDAEMGLLILTLRDLWLGYMALGGETSNGRGTLAGHKATLRIKRHDSTQSTTLAFADTHQSMNLVQGDRELLDSYIAQAQNPPNYFAGSRRPVE